MDQAILGSTLSGIFVATMIVGVLCFVFWLWMLIDCVQRPFKNNGEKIAWIIGMLFLAIPVSIIYYFVIHYKNSNGVS